MRFLSGIASTHLDKSLRAKQTRFSDAPVMCGGRRKHAEVDDASTLRVIQLLRQTTVEGANEVIRILKGLK